MTFYLVLKLLHVIGFVYWLGGDLGTFFSSRFVVDPKLTPAQRATALKIMLGCDQGPKLAMPLMFALGYTLAHHGGFLAAPMWTELAVWIVALGWFCNVNWLYFTHDAAAKAKVAQFDLYFRCAVIVALLAYGGAGLAVAAAIAAPWVAVKILVFAGLVACGVYIRIGLKPFVSAFGALMGKGSSPEVEAALSGSIARVRPAVYLIWAGLTFEAAVGLHLFTF